MAKTPKNLKFEKAIEQVEEIIDQIEAGEIDLEQCLAKYENGVELLQHCDAILKRAEKKIADLHPSGKQGLSADEE